jgi:hypothetical protein
MFAGWHKFLSIDPGIKVEAGMPALFWTKVDRKMKRSILVSGRLSQEWEIASP